MQLISIEFNDNEPLYIQLYNYIKKNIINGNFKPNEKLPSKRKLSEHLNISQNTIINAYELLLDEELIISLPQKGYFVSSYNIKTNNIKYDNISTSLSDIKYDFSTKNIDESIFPYYTWNKICKNIIYNEKILKKTPAQGYFELRNTIKDYLFQSKNINVNPKNIIIGSGIEYLLTLIIQILDIDKYAIENPGYDKIYKLLKNNNKSILLSNVDNEGIIINNDAECIYTTPSNEFPLGIKMSMKRKMEISKWATKGKYIIEDDFDSEFKYLSNSSISLFELNNNTILLSTYSRSISPALRIAYMVLPDELMQIYLNKFSFYSSTVSTLDQMILNEFIKSGLYSRHINKTKALYKKKRELIISLLKNKDYISIDYDNSYLSLIIDIGAFDKKLFKELSKKYKMDISLLDDYYMDNQKTNKIIIGYSSININLIDEAIQKLINIIENAKGIL